MSYDHLIRRPKILFAAKFVTEEKPEKYISNEQILLQFCPKWDMVTNIC